MVLKGTLVISLSLSQAEQWLISSYMCSDQRPKWYFKNLKSINWWIMRMVPLVGFPTNGWDLEFLGSGNGIWWPLMGNDGQRWIIMLYEVSMMLCDGLWWVMMVGEVSWDPVKCNDAYWCSVVVCEDLWWSMTVCDGLWTSVMVYDGLWLSYGSRCSVKSHDCLWMSMIVCGYGLFSVLILSEGLYCPLRRVKK